MRRLAWLFAGLIALLGVVRSAGAEPRVERLVDLPAGAAAAALAIGPDGYLYAAAIAGLRSGTIFVYRTSGELEDQLAVPAGPSGVVALRGLAFDRQGNLYAADLATGEPGHGRVVKIGPRGRQSVFASGLTAPTGLAFDRSDVLYVSDGLSGQVLWIGPDGASAPFVEDDRLQPHSGAGYGASGLAFAPNDAALYISNTADNRVYRQAINADGSAGRLTLFADGATLRTGSRAVAPLDGPEGLAVDARGNLLVAASRSDEVDVLSPEGRLLHRVPSDGPSPFFSPTAVAVSVRYAYVANLAVNHGLAHVSRFAVGDLSQ